MSKTTPAIVSTVKFTAGNSRKAKEYIDYINRKEAIRNDNFSKYNLIKSVTENNYIVYMDNPLKTTGLFSQDKNFLTQDDKEILKNSFELAQQNGSPMWQIVFSFDNEFLKKNHFIDEKNEMINDKVFRTATREAMNRLLKLENFGDTALWSAAIHSNTDNIHVHVALMEINPTRKKIIFNGVEQYRGKMKQKSIDNSKSTFIHSFMNRSQTLNQLDKLLRQTLSKELITMSHIHQEEFLLLQVKNLLQKLPTDKRLWKYNMNAMQPFRKEIDTLTEKIMTHYNPKAYDELHHFLDNEINFYRDLYGEGSKQFKRYEDYKQNKLEDLFSRNGNILLRELSKYNQEQFSLSTYHQSESSGILSEINLFDISKMCSHSTQDYLSDLAFKRFEAEEEYLKNKNKQLHRI